jgi:hypothetical protein
MDKDGRQRGTAATVAPPHHPVVEIEEEIEFAVVALEGADNRPPASPRLENGREGQRARSGI